MTTIAIHYSNINETSPWLKSDETELDTQTLGISTETMELRLRQRPEMDTPENETSANELTPRSIDERIKQATEPIFKRVEDLCDLVAFQTKGESTGHSEVSSSRRNCESIGTLGS